MADTSLRVSEEAKARLDLLKQKGESYNDVIMRLTENDPWAGFGIADGDPETAREGMEEIRESMRQRMDERIEDVGN